MRACGNCTHSYEDKVDAVAALETRSKPASEVASERGVARETLYLWKRDLLGGKVSCAMPGNDAKAEDTGALEARIVELEELAR